MNRRFDPRTLAFLGMMTALVFASNYARIIMPIAIGGRTSFTLANIVCVLSGLLLGPIWAPPSMTSPIPSMQPSAGSPSSPRASWDWWPACWCAGRPGRES